MSREETLRSILSMESYWGSPRGGSWSDHGPGMPRERSINPRSTSETLSGVAEVISEDFDPEVVERLGETAVIPTFEEEN